MDSHGPNRADADALLDAIEAIYACATNPSDFQSLPEALAPALGARSITIWCVDTDLQPAALFNFGLSASAISDYVGKWCHSDPLIPTALHSYRGRSVTAEEMIGARCFEYLPVFEGHYQRHDIVRPMGHFDFADARWMAGLVSERGRADPPPSLGDRRRMNTLAHHLQRAWRIALRMGVLNSRIRGAETLLSTCRLATWLVDGRRRVHAANHAAERLASTNESGIMDENDSLRFADAKTDAAFAEALRHLEAGQRTPADLSLRHDGGQAFVWGTVIPIGHDVHGAGTIQTLYLLVLARPGSDADVSWRQLEQRLPISRTEADVLARLMRAEDPAAIADARGSTLETIRSYEKSLRTKLDCHSRAELVARGWRTVAAIPSLGTVTV